MEGLTEARAAVQEGLRWEEVAIIERLGRQALTAPKSPLPILDRT